MVLITNRLQLDFLQETDFNDYFSWYGNAEVMRFISGKPFNRDEAKKRFHWSLALHQVNPSLGFFKVKLKSTKEFIGIGKAVLLENRKLEIGYGLVPQFYGKGYASEICSQLIHYAGTLNDVDECVAIVHPDNVKSIAILSKLGFVFWKAEFIELKKSHYYKLKIR